MLVKIERSVHGAGDWTMAVILTAALLTAMTAAAPAMAAEPANTVQTAAASANQAPSLDRLVATIEVADAAEATFVQEQLQAQGADVWAYLPQHRHLVALLTGAQFTALQQAGYRLEVDRERTDQLAQPRRALKRLAVGDDKARIAGFPCYRTVEQTYADLARIATERPELASWLDIGDSWEKIHGPGAGYDLHALVLTNKASDRPKTVFLLDGSIHAREYATAELATRFAEMLAAGYDVNADITWLLDHAEVHVIPYLNPDGRKRAEQGLLWRKNVNNQFCGNSELRGVDLNRNNSFFFAGLFGNTADECSEVFRGPGVLSEPETAALFAYMQQIFPDQRGPNLNEPASDTATGVYVTLHSFGEYMIYPYDGVNQTAPNHAALRRFAYKLGSRNGYFTCRQATQRVSGITSDMAYGEFGVASVLIELGQTFFQPCDYFESTILPANLQALLYAAKASRRPYQAPAGPDIAAIEMSASQVTQGEPVTVRVLTTSRQQASNGCNDDEGVRAVRYGLLVVDRPPWEAQVARVLDVDDGSYDSDVEPTTETIDTTKLAPGRHTLFFYAVDSAGNVGVPTAAFLDVVGGTGAPVQSTPQPPAAPASSPPLAPHPLHPPAIVH